jgi:hypothetical protein
MVHSEHWGSTMPGYRIHIMGSDGGFIASEDIECADDQDAVRMAAQAALANSVELWQRGRCVARLLPAPTPKWTLPAVGADEQ